MKPFLIVLLPLLFLGCSDSKSVTVPLGEWIEVSPDEPEAVKAFKSLDRSPNAKLVSARIKAEKIFMRYELIYLNGDTKWKARLVKERWRMIDIKEMPDGSSGGTLVSAGDHTDYQLQTLTSITDSEEGLAKTGRNQIK